MLVSELADRADVPLATVKYYLREGLLPPGENVGPRRAEYDEAHLRRLRVLRALREVGGAPVSALQVIVDADRGRRPGPPTRCSARCPTPSALRSPTRTRTRTRSSAGASTPRSTPWAGAASAPTPPPAAGWHAVVQLGGAELLTVNPEILGYYARLADELCRTELSLVDPTKDRQGMLEDMVVGEAVFGEILALFRRLGHEHYDAQRTRLRRRLSASARPCALVEADGGGGGEVEALGAAVDRDPHAVVGQGCELGRQAPRLVAEEPGRRPGQELGGLGEDELPRRRPLPARPARPPALRRRPPRGRARARPGGGTGCPRSPGRSWGCRGRPSGRPARLRRRPGRRRCGRSCRRCRGRARRRRRPPATSRSGPRRARTPAGRRGTSTPRRCRRASPCR